MDHLVAISLLHDVSILLEQEEREGKCVKSRNGSLFPHAYLAGYLVAAKGFPEEIVHAIIAHTVTLRMPIKTLEGVIVQCADLADNDSLRLVSGLKSLRETYGF